MFDINFDSYAAQCAPQVSVATLRAMATVESGMNPYAIGIVNGRLARQPKNISEAVSTVAELKKNNVRFSAGLIQIYSQNWSRLNINSETVFDVCSNMQAAQSILVDCFRRTAKSSNNDQLRLRSALSCYYSNNFVTGYQHGYVQRVVATALGYQQSR
jgi:type IV secretion system protein VirB1